MTIDKETYLGYEMGPIRPPSEAHSLLLRLTRNCPWNRCTFCPVYKNCEFSVRSVEHVKRDIDTLNQYVTSFKKQETQDRVRDQQAYLMALRWYQCGMKSVFLQDADSLSMSSTDIINILNHLYHQFPTIKRVTSYARSSTIAKIDDIDLINIANAGLTRLHIGLESGSNQVLKYVRKGASKEIHIRAGQKVKRAGIELSEYVMPGLGGVKLSKEHAMETADALNQINPDFIRLRQLAVPNRAPLADHLNDTSFEQCNDIEVIEELKLFIEKLENIQSMIVSDHILNLLQEINGKMPEDKSQILDIIDTFLGMDQNTQHLFIVGRRIGLLNTLSDLNDLEKVKRIEKVQSTLGVTPENIHKISAELMTRFI
jgi:hypothetical protein